MTLKQIVRLKAGHRVEVIAPELAEGDLVDVVIQPCRPSLSPHASVLEFLDTLPKGKFFYNEATRKIVSERGKQAYSIGDKLRVSLVKVDLSEKRLTFMLIPS